MGWWSQDEQGASFAGDGSMMWGDGPADIIDAALAAVVEEFERHLERKPTREEVIAGIRFALPSLPLSTLENVVAIREGATDARSPRRSG